jgi:phasin family protein
MNKDFPFLQMDMQKFMKDFKFPGFDADAMKKALDTWKMPMSNGNAPFDVEALMAAHRRNLETLTKANQTIADSFQAIASRQTEIMRGYMEELATAVKEVVSAGSPEASAQRQAAFAKKTMESAIEHMREFAELTSKSGTEVFELVNKQVMANLDQLKKAGKHEAPPKRK